MNDIIQLSGKLPYELLEIAENALKKGDKQLAELARAKYERITKAAEKALKEALEKK